jgi:hypothetical protein
MKSCNSGKEPVDDFYLNSFKHAVSLCRVLQILGVVESDRADLLDDTEEDRNNLHGARGSFLGGNGLSIVRVWSFLHVKENIDFIVGCRQRVFHLLLFILLLPLATEVDNNSPIKFKVTIFDLESNKIKP